MLLLYLFLSISFESEPLSSMPPISVSIDQMKITGKCKVPDKYPECPNSLSEPSCGKTCWFNPQRADQKDDPPTFEYTFKGEQYQIYGKYDKDHGNIGLYLDDVFVQNISQHIDSNEEIFNALQYTSPLIPYGIHTIKVKSYNEGLEIYKFAYWPSVHAKRLNSTEILPLWNVQSDGIGGQREWAHENRANGIRKITTIEFSKIWIYGSTEINHGNMLFTINGEEHFINENTTDRVDGVLVYESENLPLNNYTITFSQHFEDCLLNCIFFLQEPPPPTPPPISVSIDMMKITGKCKVPPAFKQCGKTLSATPCGKTCWFNNDNEEQVEDPPTFEYTFKGEKYQIYGKYDIDHGNIGLYLDNNFVQNVSQYTDGPDIQYALLYTSPTLPYGEHTIRVESVGDDFEIYKFAYWPSVHAQRLNSTEILPLWNIQSDDIGGQREWAHENNKAGVVKSTMLKFSKIWVYGSTFNTHGDMLFTIDNEEIIINENTSERIDNYLLYESEYLPLKDHTITFSQHVEDCLLYCIYYIPIETTIPISVSIDQMTITGKCKVPPSYKVCPNSVSNEPCGKTCWFNPANNEQKDDPPTFEYTFKGEKFQVYGKYDIDHGNFSLYLDNVLVKNVSQYTSAYDVEYALQYTSDLLPYGTHTIKVQSIGQSLSIYKFAYWPSLRAQRLNSTQISPAWNVETDNIGGLREWAHENNKAGVKKIITAEFSKIWVYGATDNTHGDMLFMINGEEHFINQYTENRVDGVLVYESENLPLNNYTITFSQHVEDCLLYCIYYLKEPPPPTPPPISVSIDMMKITGKCKVPPAYEQCGKTLSATPCGKTCWFNNDNKEQVEDPPTFEYTFKGEKYQIYGKYDRDHGNIGLYLDNNFVQNVSQYTDGPDIQYALLYTSPTLPYGEHTIRVESVGDDFEIYKFAYWPSVHAQRLNSTEILPLWNIQSDDIGGQREWAHENNKAGVVKSTMLKFSKIWVYGSTFNTHGDMLFTIDNEEIIINENTSERIDNYLLYESEYLPLKDHTITFSQHVEDCLLYCIYYIPIETTIPISVSIDQMTITGSYGTENNNECGNSIATSPCGKTVWFNPISQGGDPPKFEYKFKGEKFQVYGKYDPDHGEYDLYLDNVLLKTINQYGTYDVPYALQYSSDILPYEEHTIRIEMKGAQFEIYKFAYWPCVRAKRLNSTEFNPLWATESDKIGGQREWAHENVYAGIKKVRTFEFSKIWVYGSTDITHGDMFFSINGVEYLINENTTNRVDGVLVFESEILPLEHYTVTFSQHFEDCVLYCVYYLPFSLPTAPPISVPIEQIKITGLYGTSLNDQCPSNKVSNKPCGTTAWYNPDSHSSNKPTFSYTFKGEKYQVFGKYDPDHGKYKLYLDDVLVQEIDQYGTEDIPYALQYTSPLLPYGEHTIRIEMMDRQFELYKFAYWPSIHAQRLNSTQILPLWNVESDKIGGLREWAHENSYAGVKKTTKARFSKIWIYGATDNTHGDMSFTINGEEHLIDQYSTSRFDGVLLYESDYLPLDDYTLTFSQHVEDCVLYCIYYLPVPPPTPPPISVRISQMTITGEKRNENVECPNEVATSPCGETSWFNPLNADQSKNPPKFEYTFKGEKYQVYGKYDPDHGDYNLFLDDKPVKTISQYGTYDVPYALQYTSDVLPYGEHTIRIEMKNAQFELYKFAYWPSVNAERLNSTQILPLWNVESDKIGGLREWAHENSFAGVEKKAKARFSKIWVYGSTDYTHGEMLFKINEKEFSINQYSESRVDGVLVYESEYLPLDNYTITFSQKVEDCVLQCVYYIPLPPPTATPPPTPTMSPTATPEASPLDYILKDDNCNFETRCNVTISNPLENILVTVLVTNFTNFKHAENGGAIHIINGGIHCNQSLFDICESEQAGGAIYIHNDFDYCYSLDLLNLSFSNCAAQFGGAAYIYSRSPKSSSRVHYCTFVKNTAKAEKSTTHKNFGGSALYLMINDGNLLSNSFSGNKGPGGALKIINDFPNEQSSRLLLGFYNSHGSVIIADCSFEIEKDSDCSLFYIRGNNGAKFELNRCQFTGKLHQGSHYIDGNVISENSPELVVKSCIFDSDLKNSINLENKKFFSIDIKSQVFKNGNNNNDDDDDVEKESGKIVHKSKDKKWKMIITLALPVVGVVAIAVFAVALFVMKRINNREAETELPDEIHESLL